MGKKIIRKNYSYLVLFDIFFFTFFLVMLVLPLIIEKQIKKKLSETKNISVKNVSVSIFPTGIILSDIKATNLSAGKSLIVNGTIKKIKISGIPVWNILRKNSVEIGSATLWKPEIILTGKHSSKKDKDESEVPGINFTGIRNLTIFDGECNFTNKEGDNYAVKDLMFFISPLNLTRDSIKNIQPVFSFSTGAVKYAGADSISILSAIHIQGSTDDHQIVFDSVKVTPSYTEEKFSSKIKFQSDRFDFSCPKIMVSLADSFLSAQNIFHAQEVRLKNPDIKVYRDKRVIRDPKEKRESLQYYLKESSLKFIIDSFFIDNGNVKYREYAEKADRAGEIDFTKVKIEANNINTGDDTGSEMILSVDALFMKSGKLNAKLNFPYGKNEFHCEGRIAEMPFINLNKMTGPNAGILFNEGYVNSMQFNFTANNIYASGDLNLKYRDMKFTVSNEKQPDDPGVLTRIKTAAAGLFIKKEGKKDNVIISLNGKICHQRNEQKFIFNYIWKSILSGIRSALTESFTPSRDKPDIKLPC